MYSFRIVVVLLQKFALPFSPPAEGHVHVQKLLDLLNTAEKTAVALRIDILQTILGVFQLDSSRKAMFRDGCGFHYLISVLTSLYESLGPVRPAPWDKGELGLKSGTAVVI